MRLLSLPTSKSSDRQGNDGKDESDTAIGGFAQFQAWQPPANRQILPDVNGLASQKRHQLGTQPKAGVR